MLSWIIQITIVSIILIFLVHHLINFFKSTLTVPKIKDLVNSPTQKYENMYNIIKNNSNSNSLSNMNSSGQNPDYTLIDLLPTKQEDPSSMKTELKNFLKKQLKGSSNMQLESIDSSQSYAMF
jgi:hypothetical protein